MTEKDRIAELEAKLAAVQKKEAGGQDPELLAKAKNLARMSWYDVSFAMEYFGMDTPLLSQVIEVNERHRNEEK